MTRYRIPRTVKGVLKEVGQLSAVLTETGWKRAAALAAVVRLDPGGGGRNARKPAGNGGFMSATEFSELGFPGLRSKGTVTLYVQRWLDVYGEYPQLDELIVLPAEDWPPVDPADSGSRVSSDPVKAIEQIVQKHGVGPVAEAVVDDQRLDSAISRTRLDRVSTPRQRRELIDRGRARDERLDATIGASHAALADHVDHEVELELDVVETYLRRAVSKSEAFPYRSESQRERIEQSCDRIEQYAAILRRGEGSMTDADRRFLEAMGVES